MATLLDGKKLSAKIIDELKIKLSKLDEKPTLAVILVGENESSKLYVGMKSKKTEELGMKSLLIKYPIHTEEETIINKIHELNNDKNITAILVQLPLPTHIDSKNILQAISPQKDVDGITPENIGRISIGAEPYAYPCTPKGILLLLDEYKISLEGKHVVIIGRSNIVGKPLAQMLLNKNATVTVCHSHTKHLSEITKTADILVSAVGSYKLITKNMVKKNSVIVDVGVSKIDGKTCGDVDFESVLDVVSFITPPIGGVGPMTIASLMSNTYELFIKQKC